jgi:phosphatidylserine/phosphatidylglycerophosphate/cardiolipin synthase-like enzyme
LIVDPWAVAEIANDLASVLSEDAARSLLPALDEGVTGPAFRHAVRNHVPDDAQELVHALVAACGGAPATGAALAAAVVTRSRVEAEKGSTEIVWTGPATVPVPSHRPTTAVAHELIASAKQHITLATFSAGKVDDLIDALDNRRREGVKIRLLLETPRPDGTGPDAPKAFERLVPYINALHWPRSSRTSPDWTSMHVKVLIRDEDAVLVTSANMSRAAMRDNMEFGVKIEGGSIPARLRKHFDDLENGGVLRPLAGKSQQ